MKRYLLFLVAAIGLIGCIQYSHGTRGGNLIKFSEKGLISKTWEGSLNLGGMIPGDRGMIANVWDFSIDPEVPADAALIPLLDSALASGQRIEITYNQEFVHGPFRSHTSYFAKSVKFK